MSGVPVAAQTSRAGAGIGAARPGFYLAYPTRRWPGRVRRMVVVLTPLVVLGMLVSGCAPVSLGGAPTATEPPTTAPGGYSPAQPQPAMQASS